jgi:hypothetical protein
MSVKIDPEEYIRKWIGTASVLFSYMGVDRTSFNTSSNNVSIREYNSYDQDDSFSDDGWVCKVSGYSFKPDVNGGFKMFNGTQEISINENWGYHVFSCMKKEHVCNVWKIKISNYGPLSKKNKDFIINTIQQFAQGRQVSMENRGFNELYELLNIKDGKRRRLTPILLLSLMSAPIQAAIASIAVAIGLITSDSISSSENKSTGEIIFVEGKLNQFDILLYLEIQNYFRNFVSAKDLISEYSFNNFKISKGTEWANMVKPPEEHNIRVYPMATQTKKIEKEEEEKKENNVEKQNQIEEEEEKKEQEPALMSQNDMAMRGYLSERHGLDTILVGINNAVNSITNNNLSVDVNIVMHVLNSLTNRPAEREEDLRNSLGSDLNFIQSRINNEDSFQGFVGNPLRTIELVVRQRYNADPSRFIDFSPNRFINNLYIFNASNNQGENHLRLVLKNLLKRIIQLLGGQVPNGGEVLRLIYIYILLACYNNSTSEELNIINNSIEIPDRNVYTETIRNFIPELNQRVRYIISLSNVAWSNDNYLNANLPKIIGVIRGRPQNTIRDNTSSELPDILERIGFSANEESLNDIIMRETLHDVFVTIPYQWFGLGTVRAPNISQSEVQQFYQTLINSLHSDTSADRQIGGLARGTQILNTIQNSQVFNIFRQRFAAILPERNLVDGNDLIQLGSNLAELVDALPEVNTGLGRLQTNNAQVLFDNFANAGVDNYSILQRLQILESHGRDLINGWTNRYAEYMERNSPNLISLYNHFRAGMNVLNNLRNNAEFRETLLKIFKKILISLGFIIAGNFLLNAINKGGEKLENSINDIVEGLKKQDPEAVIEIVDTKKEGEATKSIEVLSGFTYIEELTNNDQIA